VIEEEVEDGRKSRAWLVVAVAVVICAAVTVYLMKREPAADPSRPRTLAVLPFRQLSPSPSDQYLGVGLTDAVITRLSNLRQLVVRPTGTVLKYTAPADLRGPGHELGVEAVLDGSLQKSGDRLRLTVQLVRVDDGRPLWAETFDEQLTSLFALEDSVSEKVAHALSIRLGGEERQMLARHDTENVEAYRNYLQGRVAEFRFTREGMNEAIGDFNRAIGLDPKYALAYAGLADAYATASDWVLAPRQAMPKAEAAARQALAIDDRLAEAHGALAHALMHQWHLKEANTEFERALALNPNQTAFYFAYGEYLTAISEDARAVAELRAGLRLDPLSADLLAMIGWPLYLKGDYQGGLAACQEAERIYPDYWLAYMGAGFDLLALRRNEEAVAAFEKARTLNPESTINLSGRAAAWAAEGQRAKVADLLAAMKKMSAQQYVSPMDLALVHLVLGERDAALASLEKAYDDQSEMMLFLKRYPLFEPLRGEARFQALVGRVTSD